jgi:hypothetical protein
VSEIRVREQEDMMSESACKVFWSTPDVAKAIGWDVQRTRRWLKKHGAAVRIGDRYYMTKSLLRRVFPEASDEVLSRLPDRDD